MKKFVLALIVISSVTLLNAQVKIKAGFKAGLNSANLTNIDNGISFDSESIVAFHIGGTLSFKFAKFYTLQPEILYSKQGSKLKSTTNFNSQDPILGINETINVNLSYLSIPINNKFFITNSGFHFQVAPVIDILINHKNIESPEGFDIAIAGGLGYEFPFGMVVDLRYKQGLTDVFGRNVNTGNGYETTDISDLVLNKVIQLSIGYQFDL